MIEVIYEEQKNYHLFSEGTKEDVLFQNEEEFRIGMNIVAISAYSTGIDILAFTLMDNHFHFVVHTSETLAISFVSKLMQMYQVRRLRWRPHNEMEPIKWKMAHLDTDEYLKTAIAYVLRNPVSSTHDVLFYYQWSSIALYFNPNQTYRQMAKRYQKIEDYQVVEIRKILGTKLKLPRTWLLSPGHQLWPGNFVNTIAVQGIFRDPSDFLYRVSYINRERRALLDQGIHRIGITDLEARATAKEFASERFGTEELGELTPLQKQLLAKELHNKASVTAKQIKKILKVVLSD